MWNNNNISIVQQVIDQGLKIMQNGQVMDAIYQIWVEYSKSMLKIATNNPSIYSNYLTVILAASNPNMQPYQRLSMCLSAIFNQYSNDYII